MKKLLSIVAVAMFACFSLFAETQVSPGIRFSVLGVEPTVAFNVDDFEAEIGLAVARDGYYEFDSSCRYHTLLTPNITIGWNYDAFDTGWHNLVGFTYYCGLGFKDDYSMDHYHLAGLGYRGSIRFRNNLEICFRTNLPFVVIDSTRADPLYLTIADAGGFGECILYGLAMSSIGVRIGF